MIRSETATVSGSRLCGLFLFAVSSFAATPTVSLADNQVGGVITIASTTSTDNSGLLDWLLPVFEADTEVHARVVAVGTGQAIRLARNGDADIVLVHHKASEEALVADGVGVERIPVMHNDFILVGPASDPAHVNGLDDIAEAFRLISSGKRIFASRGDTSGTHEKELELWQAAGVDPRSQGGTWYRETGSGMGATLNVASGLDAYTLSDRATWMNFGNKGDLRIVVEGDKRLHNPYSIIQIDPERYPHVNAAGGQAFIDWIVSEKGQGLIREFRIEGQQVFFPDAIPEATENAASE
ncbi:MAG: substrate-binding domain-containing protein [Gammaproteobacteria bacterium]